MRGHHHSAEARADDRDIGLFDDRGSTEPGISVWISVEVSERAAQLLELVGAFRSQLKTLVALAPVFRSELFRSFGE